MVKKGSTNTLEKRCFWVIVLLSFAAIWIYNILTPVMSDELLFDAGVYQTWTDFFVKEYERYMTWNGRSVLQGLMTIACLIPKRIFNFVNSVSFVLLSLFIYWNIEGRKKYDCFLYVLIQLCIWNLSVDFSQTVLWLSGACNYLWGMTIIMGFLTAYRYLLKETKGVGNRILIVIGMFFFGVLAGWMNENTSGGAILIVLLMTAIYIYENHKVERWMVTSIGGMVVGFLFMFLAPGNKIRGDIMKAEETYSGIAALVSRGLKVIKSIDKYLFVYIIVIIMLGTYFYYKKYKLEEFKEVAIFAVASLATAGVLIFTPEPMPRAYFGANIYMMIAALQMVQKIRVEDTWLMTLKTGGILVAAVAMIFVYIEEGANLARVLREVEEREEYILEQTAQGNYDLTLPMLRPQFESKYTFMYESDISDDEEFWINKVFCIHYGLEHITAVPREEWDEYMGY